MSIKSYKKGNVVQDYLFIKNLIAKTASNGSRYFNLILTDKAFDEIDGRMWDVSKADEEEFVPGVLVKVRAAVQEYNGKLQVIIQKIRLANEGDPVSIDDFVHAAPFSSEAMLGDIKKVIASFKNEDLKAITLSLVEDKEEALMYFPAAKRHHHALKGGLLYHTLSMLKIGMALAPLYPFINADLLNAGIILHDLGKVDEMISDPNGIVSDYTAEGKLLGHIVTGIADLKLKGEKLGTDPEILLLLEHMLLSHHYEAEYGSPKRPMFAEAELLHHIDVIDARMNTMERIQSTLEPGTFSDNQWSLDGIQVYRTTFK